MEKKFREYILEELIKEVVGKFTPDMLNKLKKAMAKISKIDPMSPAYKGIEAILDGLDKKQLQQFVDAEVKFLDKLAQNRLREMEK